MADLSTVNVTAALSPSDIRSALVFSLVRRDTRRVGPLLPVRRRRWAKWFAHIGVGTIVLAVFEIQVNRHADASGRHSLGFIVLAAAGEAVVVTVLASIAIRWLPSRRRATSRAPRRELPPPTPWRRDGG